MDKGQELYAKAKRLIPGGTQLLSKRPEFHLPGGWPPYYASANGCEVTDIDGRTCIDMSYMGIGSCILGYSDPDVDGSVKRAIDAGSMCTLNPPEEVELAERLIGLHPWADMARFARSGGEAMALAVRIARARTDRDTVLFCGYHGWHDWYLAANLADDSALDGHLLPGLSPAGVPRALAGTAYPFAYNDAEALAGLAERHAGSVGAIVIESIRDRAPEPGFIDAVRTTADTLGAILVVDEITAAFRQNVGGAHLMFGLVPDIAVFAKALSNGYPMAAVIGTGDVMDAAQTSFISSTYWTERLGPVAALATLGKLEREEIPAHLMRTGRAVMDAWEDAASEAGLAIHVGGVPSLAHFAFESPAPQVLKTLFTQLMLERGFLATTAFYASYAHKDSHVESYAKAAREAFAVIGEAIASGDPAARLAGPPAHSGFKRLT
jgi:glutamate-1-semialdehyde aminotransferase